MITEKIQQLVENNLVEFVDVKFVDLLGEWHHITVPIERLTESLFKNGIGVDGSSVSGFAHIKSGDMILLPDPETAFIDPFWDRPTLSFIGNVVNVNGTVEEFTRNPRWVARKAEKYLKDSGFAADSMWGPEFEFYLLDHISYDQGQERGFYFLDSNEAQWRSGDNSEQNLGYNVRYKGGYHTIPPKDKTYQIRNEMTDILKRCGVPVKYHHHEVGGAGQQEIEVMFGNLVEMADRSMIVKYVVKNCAYRFNKSATFMPKPLYDEPGNGMHVHQYLINAGKSVFHDASDELELSDIGRWYIGGVLKHAASLLCFTSASTNSYKRLVPGFEAPVRATYSVGNRNACIRIPGYQLDKSTYRMEFRPPDATCNPYLAFAAMLMAGLDGIKNKIEPGEPCDDDMSQMSEEELLKIPQLPSSLQRACEALAEDHDYLLEGGVFTTDVIAVWLELKMAQVDAIRLRPHPHEFRLYYDC
ncbi:MAG: type I glutamate--ammonia ligase [candidate division Zixibacteria bacterium]|jgi:glutamine synthetase|nr:type I glutamate--ammonia ligase [candidate division Zixibacteria bacterium]